MPSFRQISAHFPALVIDAASSEVQVGLLNLDGTQSWQTSSDESGVAVFEGVRSLGVNPQDVAAFVYCDGPGSVLGIRTVAMALRVWRLLKPRPIFAYCSLAIVAHSSGRENVSVIADARRDAWHCYRLGQGLRRVPATALSGELMMPQNFRHWSALPSNVQAVPYSLAALLPKVWEADLLLETTSPDAFLHEEPNYVTWSPQIHRAADSRS